MTSQSDKVEVFRTLHDEGCFVIPNPWDVGSAVLLEHLGFKALATTSAGFAWSLGRPDQGVERAEVLEHLRQIASAVEVPVSADFEGGYASDPEGVAESVELAAATGIAGLSIEDSTRGSDEPLYPFDLAVERVRAARRAIDESGTGIVLTDAPRGSSSEGPTSTRRSAACRRTPRPVRTASTHRSSTRPSRCRRSSPQWHRSR